MHRRTPHANFLDKKRLKKLYMKDRKKNGKNDLSKYILGKLPVSELSLFSEVNLPFFSYAVMLCSLFFFTSITFFFVSAVERTE